MYVHSPKGKTILDRKVDGKGISVNWPFVTITCDSGHTIDFTFTEWELIVKGAGTRYVQAVRREKQLCNRGPLTGCE